jgi:hypothetical protein
VGAAACAPEAGEPGAIMASSTLSETPLFLRLTSDSARRSNLVGVERILEMTTDSGNPALIIWTTESLVSTSCATEVATGSDSASATTRANTRAVRVIESSGVT